MGVGGSSSPGAWWSTFVRTSDGGTQWVARSPVPPLDNSYVKSLTCPTATSCYGIAGWSVKRSTNGGTLWRSMPGGGWLTPDCGPGGSCAASHLDAVSCARGSAACIAVGRTANGALAYARSNVEGSRFVPALKVPKMQSDAAGFDISCGTAQSCMVVSHDGRGALVTTDDGGSWTHRMLPRSVLTIESLTCSGTKVCATVVTTSSRLDSVLIASTENAGRTWSVDVLPNSAAAVGPSSGAATVLSCATPSACFASLSIPNQAARIYKRTASGEWVGSAAL